MSLQFQCNDGWAGLLTTALDDSVDHRILQYMIDSGAEFIMEVTDKTKADVKVRSLCFVFRMVCGWRC